LQITYHGFDVGQPKLAPDGVEIHYVPRRGNLLARYLRFLGSCVAECGGNYDVIFLKYFAGCSLLRLWHLRKQFVLDIRTGSIAERRWKRWCQDLILRVESLGFRHVTVISTSLARKLGLAQAHLLPLGADPVETGPKDFSALRLLYVGTFHGRRIEDTLAAFHRLYLTAGQAVEMTYDVVGDGFHGELDRLRTWVRERGLDHVVSLPGFVPHRELARYYEKCNVGVSYVPINRIYDCQPPTKTFEYLLAGLPVIATNTSENAAVITEHNRTDALKYSWEAVVRANLIPYINSLQTKGRWTI
jgi:glycosyltransferase involved in cell wall biosynthesis